MTNKAHLNPLSYFKNPSVQILQSSLERITDLRTEAQPF